MAKGAYFGIGGVARKIKKGYFGIEQEVPIYEETTTTVSKALNNTNIAYFFTVSSETGTSAWTRSDASGGGLQLKPGNTGVNSSTATITLTAKQALSSVKISGAYYTESGYDKITLTVAGTTVLSAVSGSSANAQRWTGSLAKDKTIVLKYVKDSSSHATDETNTAFTITCSNLSIQETTQTIVGYETKGIAHKIKKAYIGIGGVARPCWSDGELVYYGKITDLSVGRYSMAAASNGSYALFAGGYADGASKVVDAYNSALTHSLPTDLGMYRSGSGGASVGNYAIFGGGSYDGERSDTVRAYNKSLTRSSPTVLTVERTGLVGASIGSYALLAGGTSSSTEFEGHIDAYNTSLVHSNNSLGLARDEVAAANVGEYVIFAGGRTARISGWSKAVVALNKSLTRSSPTTLTTATTEMAGATTGSRALFAGGNKSGGAVSTVYTYDTSLVMSTIQLSSARDGLAGATLRNFAIFAGGTGPVGTVEVYDASLTRTKPTGLSVARYDINATTIGNFALFAGGLPGEVGDTSDGFLAVEAYTIS